MVRVMMGGKDQNTRIVRGERTALIVTPATGNFRNRPAEIGTIPLHHHPRVFVKIRALMRTMVSATTAALALRTAGALSVPTVMIAASVRPKEAAQKAMMLVQTAGVTVRSFLSRRAGGFRVDLQAPRTVATMARAVAPRERCMMG